MRLRICYNIWNYLVTSLSIFYSYQPLVTLTMACRARFTSCLPEKLHPGTWRPSGPAIMFTSECFISSWIGMCLDKTCILFCHMALQPPSLPKKNYLARTNLRSSPALDPSFTSDSPCTVGNAACKNSIAVNRDEVDSDVALRSNATLPTEHLKFWQGRRRYRVEPLSPTP